MSTKVASRPSKRQKIKPIAEPHPDARPDSDDDILNIDATEEKPVKQENEDINSDEDQPAAPRPTEVESALPAVHVDKAAIKEYETRLSSRDGIEVSSELKERIGNRSWTRGRSSIYVDAFNLALRTVLDEEGHLFNGAERRIFEEWGALSYDAQYLYVRLFLRKTAAWHRISKFKYYSDIADMDTAVESLERARSLTSGKGDIKNEVKAEVKNEVKDETKVEMKVELKEEVKPEVKLTALQEARVGVSWSNSFNFADGSSRYITTLEEASLLLSLDELRAIAREAKLQGKNKTELLKSLREMSRHQGGLGYFGLKRSNTEPEKYTVKKDSSDEGGSSITRNPTLRRQMTEGYAKKENTPRVQTPPTFDDSSRDQHFVTKILENTGASIRLSEDVRKLFERVHLVYYRSTEWTEKSLTTIVLAHCQKRNFPQYIVSRSTNIFISRDALLEFEASLRLQYRVDDFLEFGPLTEAKTEASMQVFEDVHPRWKLIIAEEQHKEDNVYDSGEGAYLRRFSPGWVYTRIVHKVATIVLARLKHHKREYDVLTDLLTQRLFHPTRRGIWYQRKALLEEHYMAELDPDFDPQNVFFQEQLRKRWKRVALATCEQGLQDSQTHVIYHYDLQKRIRKLEKQLKIAKRLQHDFGHLRLAQPAERTVKGIQIVEEHEPAVDRRGAKTKWVDEEDGETECSVEAMCLTCYRQHGWKGYHAEGGIIRTLFAYLFYDILFLYIPNVFQTPYQTCPLDLHTDAFFPSRASEIYGRLAEISNGDAAKIIKAVDAEHRENATCAVGLRWDFAPEDLLEIAECFDGAALATVCMVMAQEYGQRGGGVPDLFLWRTDTKEVMFAEVKSENDKLSDTQRLWIHVLMGAGVKVELTHAEAKQTRIRAT